MLRASHTAWKVSKHGPEKTPYLDTFHTVSNRLKLKVRKFKCLSRSSWNLFKIRGRGEIKVATVGILSRKLLLKILLYSQENTCVKIALFKKRLPRRCFPVNIPKFLRTPILKNICDWLLLYIGKLCNYNLHFREIKLNVWWANVSANTMMQYVRLISLV